MKRQKRRTMTALICCISFFLISLVGDLPVFANVSGHAPASSGSNAPDLTQTPVPTRATEPVPTLTGQPAASGSPAATQSPDGSDIPTATTEPTLTPATTQAPTAVPTPTKAPTPTAVPTPTKAPTPTATPTPEPYPFDKAIARVDDFVNVRQGASTDTPIIGKLYKDGIADVLGTEGDWTHISSGQVKGYIFSEYLYQGESARQYADRITVYNAVVTANSMNVRSEPNTNCKILGTATYKNTFPVILSASTKEWIAVRYSADTIAYLYYEYVELVCNQKEAMTLEQIAAAERAAKIEKAHILSLPVTYRDPILITDEELELFALVVAAEANSEPYDGKLAVANVILNRLYSGRWGDTILDVVSAPGQFTGYQYIDRYRTRDIKDCYSACKEALAGKNNIGDFLFFHADYYVDEQDEWLRFSSWYRIEGHIFFKRSW